MLIVNIVLIIVFIIIIILLTFLFLLTYARSATAVSQKMLSPISIPNEGQGEVGHENTSRSSGNIYVYHTNCKSNFIKQEGNRKERIERRDSIPNNSSAFRSEFLRHRFIRYGKLSLYDMQ